MQKVGLIPYVTQKNAIAVLFVTSMARGRWILPKGNVRKGENPLDAVHREGFEEAGVKGKLIEQFPFTIPISKSEKGKMKFVPVTYYPLLVTEQYEVWPEDDKRERHWALLDNAINVVHRHDFLDLLNRFKALQPWLIEAAGRSKDRLPKELTQAR